METIKYANGSYFKKATLETAPSDTFTKSVLNMIRSPPSVNSHIANNYTRLLHKNKGRDRMSCPLRVVSESLFLVLFLFFPATFKYIEEDSDQNTCQQ